MPRTAVDLTVTGRVQGVSFRATAAREAARLGLAGWVRNAPGGEVTAHVEGAAEDIEAFVRWCHDGPGRLGSTRSPWHPAPTPVRGRSRCSPRAPPTRDGGL